MRLAGILPWILWLGLQDPRQALLGAELHVPWRSRLH